MKTGLILVFVLFLTAVSAFLFLNMKPEPGLMALSRSSVVLAYGNSITYGTGVNEKDSYPAVLSELIGVEVINEGVPGEVISEGLERLPSVVAKHNPQLVLLCEGGNDLLRKREESEIARDLEKMVIFLKDRMIDIIIIGVPAPGLSLKAPDFYKRTARKLEVPYGGDILERILADSSLKSDYIHPNEKGYKLLAERIAEIMEKSGALILK